jgi:hypothetical protein
MVDLLKGFRQQRKETPLEKYNKLLRRQEALERLHGILRKNDNYSKIGKVKYMLQEIAIEVKNMKKKVEPHQVQVGRRVGVAKKAKAVGGMSGTPVQGTSEG